MEDAALGKTMRTLPDRPALTPQFCFSPSGLRDFLRLSRSATDDSISQNLNALVTPAKDGFDPSSTSQRMARPLARTIDAQAYRNFLSNILFPAWDARSAAIKYCTMVATSPDPNDPDAAAREAELAQDRERVVDERLDPYSARFFPQEPRTERLASLLRQESGVESIIRERTWGIVKERCTTPSEGWETHIDAFKTWQKSQGTR